MAVTCSPCAACELLLGDKKFASRNVTVVGYVTVSCKFLTSTTGFSPLSELEEASLQAGLFTAFLHISPVQKALANTSRCTNL